MDDIWNINNIYFDNSVIQIYPTELQLNKANISDTEASVLDLLLIISYDTVSTKIYNKRDDFDFEIVNFLFLDGDIPLPTSYGVYISQVIWFSRASSHVPDFNTHNKLLTQKLFNKAMGIINFAFFLNFTADTMIWYPNSILDLLIMRIIGILGQVWYLIVSIPDFCTLNYFNLSCGDFRNYSLIWRLSV